MPVTAPLSKASLTAADRVLALFVALLLFGLYIVSFDGTLHSTDGLSMLAVAENLVKHGNLDARQMENWEDSVVLSQDGRPYINDPPGPSLFMVPFLALALAVPRFGLTQTTMILMPLSSALAGLFFYLSARRLGYDRRVAITATLLAGLATMTWPRTRDLVTDPLSLLGFAASFYFALAYRQERRLSQAAWMGLALGVAILHRTANGLAVPFFFWYLAVPGFWPRSLRDIDFRAATSAALPLAACLLVTAGYNVLRFGSFLDSGFRGHISFSTPFWIGFIGLLVSPYKSLPLYVPLFILIPFVLSRTWRAHPREVALVLGLLLASMVLFGSWHDWGGGRNWGPRYLAPLNGLLTLLLLPLIDRAFQPHTWRVRAILAGFVLLSLGMQLVGISARDDVFLDAADYWTPPPQFSYLGELRWDRPDQWPVWGHLLRFNLGRLPVIWRWQWVGQSHFDPLALLASLLIVALGLAGLVSLYRRSRAGWFWPAGAWLVSLAAVAVVLWRSYDDPRSIQQAEQADELWQDYSALTRQLPDLVAPGDAVIFTDRRFEFYLLDTDKSPAQRYVISKPNRPQTLAAVPRLWQKHAAGGRLWLVTDELDNRQLAYATELWLRERGRVRDYHRFGQSLQLTAFELPQTVSWEPIPPEPQLAVRVDSDDFTFNGIASLLGWDWPGLSVNGWPRLQPSRVYPFELYWLYRGKDPADQFFIRLLAGTGQCVAEVFSSPRPGQNPVPGQLWIEDASLALPAGLPAGCYSLQVGFLTPAVAAGELTFALPPELVKIQVVQPETRSE